MDPIAREIVDPSILQGLTQDFEDVLAELRQFIQKEHAMMGPGRLRPVLGTVPPPIIPASGDGVMRAAEGPRGKRGPCR